MANKNTSTGMVLCYTLFNKGRNTSMAIKDIFKISRKTFFAPGDWLGYKFVKTQSLYVWSFVIALISPLFSPIQPEHQETFEEAMRRLNLTEENIQSAEKQYFLMALCFGAVGFILGLFCIIFLFKGFFAATLIAFGLTALIFAQAFKYHFWYFQIKHRKLGCTFEEWRQGKPLNGGEPHA